MIFILYILLKKDPSYGLKRRNPKEEREASELCKIIAHEKWACWGIDPRKFG